MAKRALDISLAATALLCFLPVGLVIALVLRCTGDGEVFFMQERVGASLRRFRMLKFVTMRTDGAEPRGALTVRNDPRVFPFGRLLRLTKLNEVPQLVNILRGDMSVVGPRPMLPRELDDLPTVVNERVFTVRPGLTGLGSIVFRDEEAILSASGKGSQACYREDVAPLKADLELWYVQHRSLGLDLKVVFMTAWMILFPTSQAYGRLLGADWPGFRARIEALHRSVGLASAS